MDVKKREQRQPLLFQAPLYHLYERINQINKESNQDRQSSGRFSIPRHLRLSNHYTGPQLILHIAWYLSAQILLSGLQSKRKLLWCDV